MREREVADTLIDLAEALVGPFDLMEFLHVVTRHCVELLDGSEAGILISPDGTSESLRVIGSSSERAEALEVLQALHAAGPCVESWRRGEVVTVEQLDRHRDRWPKFVPAARELGFQAVHSVPMRAGGETVAVLNLFCEDAPQLDDDGIRVAQALADLGALALLHDRTVRETETVVEQLQGALDSRVVIEQAKGMLAATQHVSVDDAFGMLRAHARGHNRLLREVARDVVERRLVPEQLMARSVR